tara:strand:+ start:13339 stop:13797 length:459 start_codon:yes stop_codon:yes gene_type:complete
LKNPIDIIHEWEDKKRDVQMESWLEYVWINKDKHRSPQTESTLKVGNMTRHNVSSGRKSDRYFYADGNHTKKSTKAIINTWTLYNEWRHDSGLCGSKCKFCAKKAGLSVLKYVEEYNIHNGKRLSGHKNRCYVKYVEAVPIMHEFLDYMEGY